jgi:hypothetical protein
MTHHNVNQSTTTTEIDPRTAAFTQAYLDMGYDQEMAEYLGVERTQHDEKALFELEGCVDLKTAKEFIWTLEAADLLFSGDFHRDSAVKLLEMVLSSLKA